jgi:hypothetical protein
MVKKTKKTTAGTCKIPVPPQPALRDTSTDEQFYLEIAIPLPGAWYGWFKDNGVSAEYFATRGVKTFLSAPKTPQTEACINHLKMLLDGYTTSSVFPGKVWSASSVPTKYHPPSTESSDSLPF